MLKIATWNVNSVRMRAEHMARFLDAEAPDVLAMQETKVTDDKFPHGLYEAKGYVHRLIRGEKSYNGVALVSRRPLEPVDHRLWAGREDCRHIAARIGDILIHNLYVPAGGDVADAEANDKFAHKLQFVAELAAWGKAERRRHARAVLVGDLNIAPLETDVWSHKQLLGVVSHTPVETQGLVQAQRLGGWTDAVRAVIPPAERLYSWWSYRSPAWEESDRGRRLDHVWVGPELRDRIAGAQVIKECRRWDKPSDHAPVIVALRE